MWCSKGQFVLMVRSTAAIRFNLMITIKYLQGHQTYCLKLLEDNSTSGIYNQESISIPHCSSKTSLSL